MTVFVKQPWRILVKSKGLTIGSQWLAHKNEISERDRRWIVWVKTLRPIQHGLNFADDTFKRIFLNENWWISIKISPKFVPKSPLDNIPALFQIMAWCRPGDKPLSEAMMVSLLTHICVARPQWVKRRIYAHSPNCWLFQCHLVE